MSAEDFTSFTVFSKSHQFFCDWTTINHLQDKKDTKTQWPSARLYAVKINVVSIYTRIWSVCWLLNAKQGSHCPWTAAFSGKQTEKWGLGRRSEESHVPLQNQLLRLTTNAVSSDQLPSHTHVCTLVNETSREQISSCARTQHTSFDCKFCEEVASMEIQIRRSHSSTQCMQSILCVCAERHNSWDIWSEPTLKYILPCHHHSLKYCHVHLFEEHTLLLSLGNIWLMGFLFQTTTTCQWVNHLVSVYLFKQKPCLKPVGARLLRLTAYVRRHHCWHVVSGVSRPRDLCRMESTLISVTKVTTSHINRLSSDKSPQENKRTWFCNSTC